MNKHNEEADLRNNLIFATTIYDSFEALEEALGKLKLEQPLFLVYLAKKAFAQAVFDAAKEVGITEENPSMPINMPLQIRIEQANYNRLH